MEDIKKTQLLEMKTTVFEKIYILDEINIKLDTAEEKISVLEDSSSSYPKWKAREIKRLKKKRAAGLEAI